MVMSSSVRSDPTSFQRCRRLSRPLARRRRTRRLGPAARGNPSRHPLES